MSKLNDMLDAIPRKAASELLGPLLEACVGETQFVRLDEDRFSTFVMLVHVSGVTREEIAEALAVDPIEVGRWTEGLLPVSEGLYQNFMSYVTRRVLEPA